jgi:hypothetical protein
LSKITKLSKKKKKIDVPEKAVYLVIEETMEDIKEKNEVMHEDIEKIEEPVTLAKIKDLLKAHIPKKNKLDSYCRTIEQVYGYIKVEDIHELLSTKEQDIIDYLEKKYESVSTIKSKFCATYKLYKLLNIESELFRNRIEHYAYEKKIKQDENKELNKKTIAERDAIMDILKIN